jgi:hypothetical protein
LEVIEEGGPIERSVDAHIARELDEQVDRLLVTQLVSVDRSVDFGNEAMGSVRHY